MAALFTRHDPAAQARYQDLKRLARAQRRILPGTPGGLKQRKRGSTVYWVREHIRVDGKKDDEHLGTVAGAGKARIEAARAEIEAAKALAAGSSALRIFGYQRVDRTVGAVLAALFNRGLLQAGLALVGSHAYGALLNDCGIMAAGYRTQDIDLARGRSLGVALPADLDFRGVLDESDLKFLPVPGMPSHKPPASFKLPGAGSTAVDLLAPGQKTGQLVEIAELRAHAQAIPLLDYLIRDPVEGIVLSPNQVIPVTLPSPERFVVHKLYSSQSRRSDRDKIRKDLAQAAVLSVAVEEDTPGRIEGVFRDLPSSGRTAARRGARAALQFLKNAQGGTEVLARLASG